MQDHEHVRDRKSGGGPTATGSGSGSTPVITTVGGSTTCYEALRLSPPSATGTASHAVRRVPVLPAGEPDTFRQLELGHSLPTGRLTTYRKSGYYNTKKIGSADDFPSPACTHGGGH
jgi:hypothetical protein